MHARVTLALAVLGAAGCIPIADLASGADGGDAGHAGDASDVDAGPSCPGPFGQAVSALPGLVGYWRLDEKPGTSTAADRTGKHPGTYGSSVTQGVTGLLVGDPDLAASFQDDAGSYVDVPASPDLNLQTFTLGALIHPSAITAADMGQQIVAKNYAYWLQLRPPMNGGSPNVEVGFISPASVDASPDHMYLVESSAVGVGTTSFVVGTFDGSTLALYIDDAMPALEPQPYPVATSTGDLYIGSWDGMTHLQAGVIDEVFVSKVAISPAQVHRLYLSSQGCAQGGD